MLSNQQISNNEFKQQFIDFQSKTERVFSNNQTSTNTNLVSLKSDLISEMKKTEIKTKIDLKNLIK